MSVMIVYNLGMKLVHPYHLFLDDIHTPNHVTWIELPRVEWVVVRNYEEFVQCITDNGLPLNISFDHDLAHEHYPAAYENNMNWKIPYETYVHKTGYACAVWLVRYCKEHNVSLPKWTVHTWNIPGRLNIERYLNGNK